MNKKDQENKSLPIKVGNVLKVNNQYGVPNIGFTNSIDYAIDLLDRRLMKRGGGGANADEWIKDANAEVIGKARVYDWSRLSKNDIGGSAYDFELRLLDVQGYTKLTVTPAFGTVAAANAFVEGKYSGASGYIVTGANGQTSAKLQDVKGQFQVNEPLMINGNDNGRSVTAIDDYDVSNVKSVNSNVGVSTFIADTVLDRKKEVFDPGFEFDFNGGTVRTTGISDFRGLVKVGDILSYTVANNSDNVTTDYTFETGQTGAYYGYSSILRKPDAPVASRKLKIYFSRATYDSNDTGDITTVNSYSGFHYGNEITRVNGNRLADIIDARPRVGEYAVTAGTRSPFEFNGRSFDDSANSGAQHLSLIHI